MSCITALEVVEANFWLIFLKKSFKIYLIKAKYSSRKVHTVYIVVNFQSEHTCVARVIF